MFEKEKSELLLLKGIQTSCNTDMKHCTHCYGRRSVVQIESVLQIVPKMKLKEY